MGQTNSTPSSSSSSSRHGRRSSSLAPPSGTASSSSTAPAPTASSSSHTVLSSPRSGNNTSAAPIHRQQQLPPPQQQPPQQQAASTSRLLRSTTERRRRANLFSSFYPLLSRGSFSNSNSSRNSNNGNSSTSNSNTSSSNNHGANAGQACASDNERSVNSGVVASGGHSVAPQVATVVATGSRSSTNATESNRQPSGVGRPDWPSVPGGSSNANARATSRSPALQPSSLGGRTPRGLSRVQRMYDEQSIGSTRSSSRASSVAAVSSSANAPPSNSMATLQHPPEEYMDIDAESVGLAPQELLPTTATSIPSSDASESVRPAVTPDHPSSATLLSDDAVVHSSTDQASSTAELARSRIRPDQELGSALPNTAASPDSFSPYERLLNPRGGTSISSSLLPIRPDSDDDDDMDLDHESPASSSASASASALDTPLQDHNRLPQTGRPSGAELLAYLIRHQALRSLRESTGVTEEGQQQQQQQNSPQQQQGEGGSQIMTENLTSSSISSGHDGISRTASSEGARTLRPLDNDASNPSITGLRQLHQRSASTERLDSLRRNDTSGAAAAATPLEASTGTSTEADAETPGSITDRTQFLMNQLPFFMRLLTDLSRGIRLPDETRGENAEGRTGALESESGSATDPTTLAAAADAPTATGVDSPSDSAESREDTSEAQTDSNAQPRRRNATIRFVQIGGGLGHALRNRHRAPGSSNDAGEMSGAGDAGENTSNENEGRGTAAAHEDLGEAIILFLSGPSSDPQSESDLADSTQDGSNDTTGERPRQRSPWVVLSLSGGYISSLLAAGANAEGGASYDDLWMLSNLIGPARPLTTTQEAIDGAGFPVGRFEHAVQGIRDVVTLGDGTKCLVCMSEYEEGEDMRALKCRHGFHQECIDKWLTTGANKCPVCRAAAVVSEPPAVDPEVSVAPSMAEE